MTSAYEVNFDGIVGPTHHYGGLSHGNVASMRNEKSVSHPKQAALQGLAKMKFMADLGVKQAVLPPHERPHLPSLRRLGYSGSDAEVLGKVADRDPALLSAVSSASAMWAANAATVSASADTYDGRVHFTPANLITNFHRSIETATTARVLRTIFEDERRFVHHEPLPATPYFSDEGAANHTRLGATLGLPGVELFTWSWHKRSEAPLPMRYPARQSAHASNAIAYSHRVKRPIFIWQNPAAIDAGAFHNDVVAVGHRNVLLYHELAWMDPERLDEVEAHVTDLAAIKVTQEQVPLTDAVSSYLFNSQLVTAADGSIVLVAPIEASENERSGAFLRSELARGGPIRQVHFVDVRQSMRNGGGPACLRLRVVLNEAELSATHQGVMFSDALYTALRQWVERHYRDELSAAELADPRLLEEGRVALDELTRILRLGSLYEFQR